MATIGFNEAFNLIFKNDLTKMIFGGGLINDIIFVRILFGILFFAIIWGAMHFAFGDKWSKGVQITIATIMAILTAAIIPHSLFLMIMTTWGFAAVMIAISPVLIGSGWLLFRKTEGANKTGEYAIKTIIASSMAYIIARFDTIDLAIGGKVGLELWGFIYYLWLAYLILGIYFFIRLLGSLGKKGVSKAGGMDIKDLKKKIHKLTQRSERDIMAEFFYDKKIKKDVHHAKKEADNPSPDMTKIKKHVNDALHTMHRELRIERYLYRDIEKGRGFDDAAIEIQVKDIFKFRKEIKRALEEAKHYMEESNILGIDDLRTKLKEADEFCDKIIKAVQSVEAEIGIDQKKIEDFMNDHFDQDPNDHDKVLATDMKGKALLNTIHLDYKKSHKTSDIIAKIKGNKDALRLAKI